MLHLRNDNKNSSDGNNHHCNNNTNDSNKNNKDNKENNSQNNDEEEEAQKNLHKSLCSRSSASGGSTYVSSGLTKLINVENSHTVNSVMVLTLTCA